MDVLKLYWKILVKLGKFVLWLYRWATSKANSASTNKPQPAAPAQQPAPDLASSPAVTVVPPSTSPAATPIQVVIHNHISVPQTAPDPQPQLRPAPPPSDEPPVYPTHQVLDRRDHGIYITRDASFTLRHPREEELLQGLDYILYVSAHRNGDPFTVPPALDDSPPVKTDAPLALPLEDPRMAPVSPYPLPAPDGRLWVARVAATPLPIAEAVRHG